MIEPSMILFPDSKVCTYCLYMCESWKRNTYQIGYGICQEKLDRHVRNRQQQLVVQGHLTTETTAYATIIQPIKKRVLRFQSSQAYLKLNSHALLVHSCICISYLTVLIIIDKNIFKAIKKINV